jgi:hypothetical protein
MLTTEFFGQRKKLCPDGEGTICGRKLPTDHVTNSNLELRWQRLPNPKNQKV